MFMHGLSKRILALALIATLASVVDGAATTGPAATRPAAIRPTGPDGLPATVIQFPGPISAVAAGAGGRLLVMSFKGSDKVIVFDIVAAKILRELKMAEPEPLLAAGQEKFVVGLKTSDVLERWDLAGMQRERSSHAPAGLKLGDRFSPAELSMGCSAQGPVIVAGAMGGPRAIDLNSLEQITWAGEMRECQRVRVSADGTFAAGWSLRRSPSGVRTGPMPGSRGEYRYEHSDWGCLFPNRDGSLVLTTAGGVFAPEQPQQCLLQADYPLAPAYDPAFFLGIPPGQVVIYSALSMRPLLTVMTPELPDLKPESNFDVYGIPSREQRVHYLPAANKLVTIADDSLVVRQIDLAAEMAKASPSFIAVTSVPPREAQAGGSFTHQFKLISNSNEHTYKLDAGPSGMSITPTGMLSWSVPGSAAALAHEVVLTITGKGARETVRFKVHVRPQVILGDLPPKLPTLRHTEATAVFMALTPSLELVSSHPGVVILWDVRTGRELHRIETGERSVSQIALANDGSMLAIADSKGVSVLDIGGWRSIHRLDFEGPVQSMAFRPDGQGLVTVSSKWLLQEWDFSGGQARPGFAGVQEATGVAISRDGRLASVWTRQGKIRLWDLKASHLIAEIAHGQGSGWMRFTPDGTALICLGRVQGANVYSTTNGQIIQEIRNGPRSAPAITMDRKALGEGISSACLWDLDTGKLVRQFPYEATGRPGSVRTTAVSADGRVGAIAREDRTIQLVRLDLPEP